MANQAIALQARAPQTDILGGAIRNNAQLINTMSQQRAAERQNAMAQQQMQLAQAKEARDASAAEIDMAGKKIDLYTKRAGQTLSPQGYQLLLQDLDRDAPEIAAAFRANLPPERFSRDDLLRMVGSISDNFKATYGPLETEVVQMEDGTYSVARTGGFGKPGVFELEEFALKPSGAAAAAPTAAAPAQGDVMARPTRGANTGPQDLMRQGVNPNSIPSGNPLSPISTGSAAQPDLGAIVQNMMQTGVISQADMGLMTQAAGPEKAQQLAQIMRANNIQIMPDEQAAPAGMRNAVFRPEEGAPALQQAQSMDDYVGTGRAARGKSPMQSPLPGSAQVPLDRVRKQAQAERETPAEAAAKARAVASANAAAEVEKRAAEKLPARKQVSTLISKVRGAYEALEKRKAIPSEARGGFANFMDYLASTSGGREVQKAVGTESSKYLSEIVNSRKLLATAIKNATGMSAQEMNSNTELQLMMEALTDPTQGIEAARSTLDTLEALYGMPRQTGDRPAAAPAGGQTKPKTRRYNPVTGKLE